MLGFVLAPPVLTVAGRKGNVTLLTADVTDLLNTAHSWTALQTAQGLTTTMPGWYAQLTGDAVPRVRVGLNSTDVASIAFGDGTNARDAFIERVSAGFLRHGSPDAAAPIAQTIGVQNVVAGTTDTAGVNWTFNASRGTGTGIAGNIIFQGAPHSTTGSTQNALTPILTLNGDTKVATFTGGINAGSAVQGNGPGQISSTGLVNFASNTFQVSAGDTVTIEANGSFGFTNTNSNATSTLDVILTRGGASRVLRLGAISSATPAAMNTLIVGESPRSGTDVDTAAGGGTIRAALSTGTATNPDLVFQTGVKTTTGSALGTATTALTIKGETGTVLIASGKILQLGNAATTSLTPGVLAASTNASIVISDSAGQAYRIPCII